jgi:HEPN domain-containing protein
VPTHAVKRGMKNLDWKLGKYGELLPEIMDRMERELAGEALTLWSGFSAFCAERMGVAAEKLLAATLQEGPGAEAVGRVEGLKDRAGRLGLEPDEEGVEEIRNSLAEAWRIPRVRDICFGYCQCASYSKFAHDKRPVPGAHCGAFGEHRIWACVCGQINLGRG